MATRATSNIGDHSLNPVPQTDGLEVDEFVLDEHIETKIDINFATPPPLPIEIKQDMNILEPLETTTLLSSKTPFADLMLHPENIDAVLEGMIPIPAPAPRKKKIATKATAKAPARMAKAVSRSANSLMRKTRFSFKAADANSVKLAGDFTSWEKAPIEMTATKNGDWSAVISLQPGHYSYRFIVDGKWQDDPECRRHVANSFGTHNAVIEII